MDTLLIIFIAIGRDLITNGDIGRLKILKKFEQIFMCPVERDWDVTPNKKVNGYHNKYEDHWNIFFNS